MHLFATETEGVRISHVGRRSTHLLVWLKFAFSISILTRLGELPNVSFSSKARLRVGKYCLRERADAIYESGEAAMIIKLGFLLILMVLMASAQDSLPEGFELWTAASLTQMENTLKSEAASNPHHISVKRLADFPNDTFMLSRREADGVVEWHETQADVFFVQSGTATLVVGGKMVGGDMVEPHEKRNGTIEGGVRKQLSAGDIVRIPARVPHQILLDGSKGFTYFVIKLKGY
jgi:mannose-6-phosphate isomerase-like protein (cupin superfamily)